MKKLYSSSYASHIRKFPDEYKQKILEWLEPKKTDRILELGANRGEVQVFLRKYSPGTVGIDINESVIKSSALSHMYLEDATKLSFKKESFTKSVSIHTLEHIPNLSKVFSELDRVTKKGGLSLHAFPSALIRGLDGAYVDALKMTRNPFKALSTARQLHIHALNPKKIEKLTDKTKWRLLKAERIFVLQEFGFSWIVLLQKD